MECLVPLDTSLDPQQPPPPTAPGTLTMSQTLAQGATSATFDLSAFGFGQPPGNIVPSIVRSGGSAWGIVAYPREWTATQFICDLSAPTPDGTFICSIQIFP